MPRAERALSSKDRFREVAALRLPAPQASASKKEAASSERRHAC